MDVTEARTPAPTAARVVAGLGAVGAVGAAVMSVGHAGVNVPVLDALGPGGDRALPAVATGFAIGAVLFAVVAVGAWRQRAWAWAGGLVVNGLALVSATMPWRGPVSGVAAVVTAAALAALVSRPGRAALLGRSREPVE